MNRASIARLYAKLEQLRHTDAATGAEFWLARDLQKVLGCRRWAELAEAIEEAMTACKLAGYNPEDHFRDVPQSMAPGRRAERRLGDYALTRYACYLIAQNGDPSKDRITFAQSYFAVESRQPELIDNRLADAERLGARRKLSRLERVLSGLIYERVGDERGCGRVRSKGDQALFGGVTTRAMKNRLGVPKGRALADFLPTATLKAKLLANERTIRTVKLDYLHTEAAIAREHVKNNRDARNRLRRRKIVPEQLPPAEDLKKIERRIATEEKALPEQVQHAEATVTTASQPARHVTRRAPIAVPGLPAITAASDATVH